MIFVVSKNGACEEATTVVTVASGGGSQLQSHFNHKKPLNGWQT